MTVGAGIAIAGVWIFAGMNSLSKHTTGTGFMIGAGVAFLVTVMLGGHW